MKRKTEELESAPFRSYMNSQRLQALEGIHDLFKNLAPDDVTTTDDAYRTRVATCYCNSLANRLDTTFPEEKDMGEVVAMGTEDNNACGLLKEAEGERLFEYEPTLLPDNKICMHGEKAVTAVAAGGLHSACLLRNGEVYTWGTNDEMALGRGKVEDDEVHLIKPMVGIKDAIQVSAGDSHTIVLDRYGKVYAAGVYKDSDSGLFKDLTSPDDDKIYVQKHKHHEYPVPVLGLGKTLVIDAGHSWNAGLVEGRGLYTWGMGHSGELARSKSMGAKLIEASYVTNSEGNDTFKYKKYDVSKDLIGEVKTKVGYRNGEVVIDKKTGKPKTEEYWHYFHNKVRDKFLTPAPVEWAGGQKRIVEHFSCGMIHLLVVARNHGSRETQVFSSGNSGFGQLGHGDTREIHELTPIEALNNRRIMKVAAGNYHSLALSMDEKNLYAWGKLDEGATGLYSKEKTVNLTNSDFEGTPKQVAFPDTLGDSCLVEIAAGDTTSFAITDAGDVYSWGYNENSQTGHYNDVNGTGIISRPRLLNVIASVNDGIKKSNQTPVATKCRVTRVSGGGQHALMVIKRYR